MAGLPSFSASLALLCALSAGWMASAAPTTPFPNTITGFDASLVYISSGPVSSTSQLIWYRCPKWSQVTITVSSGGQSASVSAGPVSQASDYTGKYIVRGLTPYTSYTYQVTCLSTGTTSVVGSFKTPPSSEQAVPVKLAWAADISGQGWGRSDTLTVGPYTGGLIFAQAIADQQPDVVYLQGDTIYADGAINPSQAVPPQVVGLVGFSTFNNTYIKPFLGNTLQDFRLSWLYNVGDDKYRNMLANHAMVYGWDDHEVANNWYPTRVMDLVKFGGISGAELAVPARQAFYEYNTIPNNRPIYNVYSYGAHLDLIVIDARSYRGPNTDAVLPTEAPLLGAKQEKWLKRALKDSKATWKIIGFDGPLSIVVGDGPGAYDSYATGDDAVTGREFEFTRILKYIKDKKIKGVHAITSDVHYQAIVDYSPAMATGFSDFTPFSEFIIGPSHSGAFGPGSLDKSFGASYSFLRAPGTNASFGGAQNLPPPLTQSFGMVTVNAAGDLTITIQGIDNTVITTRTYLKSSLA